MDEHETQTGSAMHELSIAQGVLDLVEQYVPDGRRGTVRRVKVRLGNLSGVIADSLEFCFSSIVAGTPLEGCRLEIEPVRALARCGGCGGRFEPADLVFLCPACGSAETCLVSGTELHVVELELEDGNEAP